MLSHALEKIDAIKRENGISSGAPVNFYELEKILEAYDKKEETLEDVLKRDGILETVNLDYILEPGMFAFEIFKGKTFSTSTDKDFIFIYDKLTDMLRRAGRIK